MIINHLKYSFINQVTSTPNPFRILSLAVILCLFLAVPNRALGQNTYEQQPIKEKRFSKEDWKKTTRNLDYSGTSTTKQQDADQLNADELERRGEQQEYQPHWSSRTMLQGSNTVKVIFFGIAILALIYVIWKIVQAQMKLKNPKVKKQPVENIEEAVENIHESDLDRFLREALSSNNYKLAIRVYYLIIIKTLAEQHLIKWKKDKTNSVYVREMRQTEHYQTFRDVTRKFERTWFGEDDIQKADFQKLEPDFQGFVSRIK